jgi:hypothetical protein
MAGQPRFVHQFGAAVAACNGLFLSATEFNTLLISRIAAGLFNGFMIAVSTQLFLSTYEGKAKMLEHYIRPQRVLPDCASVYYAMACLQRIMAGSSVII